MSERARLCALCLGSRREPPHVLGEPAILGVLVTRQHVFDPLAWCGVAMTSFVQGMWRPPSLVEKLLSETRDQGDRDCVHGKDLVAEKQYSL